MKQTLVLAVGMIVAALIVATAVVSLNAHVRALGDDVAALTRQVTAIGEDVRSLADDVATIADSMTQEDDEGTDDDTSPSNVAVRRPPTRDGARGRGQRSMRTAESTALPRKRLPIRMKRSGTSVTKNDVEP